MLSYQNLKTSKISFSNFLRCLEKMPTVMIIENVENVRAYCGTQKSQKLWHIGTILDTNMIFYIISSLKSEG